MHFIYLYNIHSKISPDCRKRKETGSLEVEELTLKRQKVDRTIANFGEEGFNIPVTEQMTVFTSQDASQGTFLRESLPCTLPLSNHQSLQSSSFLEMEKPVQTIQAKLIGSGACKFIDSWCNQSSKFKDTQRTGAKCVPNGNQDPLLAGLDYHVTESLRTKPGRGERTLSMSCSDKIMKWCTLGLQGGLLSNLLENPIYLESIIVGKCPFNRGAMLRGISTRGRQLSAESMGSYGYRAPVIYQCDSLEFAPSKRIVVGNWKPGDGGGKVAACGAGNYIIFHTGPIETRVLRNLS